MNSANDIIQCLRFVFNTENALADEIQQRCSRLFHHQLRAQLAHLFEQYAGNRATPVIIENLTLDVGDIVLSQFEQQLSQRLMQQLAQRLQASLPIELSVAPMEYSASRLKPHSTMAFTQAPAHSPGEGRIAAKADAAAHNGTMPANVLGLFERYLHSGYLAQPTLWQKGSSPDGWLIAQFESQPERWQALLARNCLQSASLQRLLQTFSHPALRAIGQLLTAGQPMLLTAREPAWARYLPLSALLFFRHHTEENPPAVDEKWAAMIVRPDELEQELLPWLLSLLDDPWPPAPELRHWLKPICATILAQTGFKQQLSSAMRSRVEQLTASFATHIKSLAEMSAKQQSASVMRDKVESLTANFAADNIKSLAEMLAEQQSISVMRNKVEQLTANFAADMKSAPEKSAKQQSASVMHNKVEQLTASFAADMKSMPEVSAKQQLSSVMRNKVKPLTADFPVDITPISVMSMTDAEPYAVSNAGLVLLWPLLPSLLSQIGLVVDKRFIDQQAQINAVCWLDGLIWQDNLTAEWRTPMTKLLCGLPLETPLFPWSNPEADTVRQLDDWLAAILQQLPSLMRCSANDLRSFFLQRPGELSWQQSHWQLQVEGDVSDVLLREVPWPLNQLILPWLDTPIEIIWL